MTHVQATTAVRGAAPTRLPAWSGHLPADVAACRLEGATDERVVRELASDLVEAIGMRAHGEPWSPTSLNTLRKPPAGRSSS